MSLERKVCVYAYMAIVPNTGGEFAPWPLIFDSKTEDGSERVQSDRFMYYEAKPNVRY